ncbi:flagellar hook-associated protein Fla [Clostridium aceticum]|uniref:Flagellin n=1 Tax=Clostridium aceticum TaxID=84022 RepID=A0A0G3W515_9CLOT|nr:flagellin [Clostridium aceticum]AKL93781.1 flagellar hook-associated protein Fla [Clostridium aceticum]
MKIANNLTAINTHRQLGISHIANTNSMQKISSGSRINTAGDDSAGLAISEKMRGQIRGLNQASRNAQDTVSLIQTAEGALNETHSLLQRIRELMVQKENGTQAKSDKQSINREVKQLVSEIDRIANTTQFNNQNLLNGKFKGTFQIGTNSGQSIALNIRQMDAIGIGVIPTIAQVNRTLNESYWGTISDISSVAIEEGKTYTLKEIDNPFIHWEGSYGFYVHHILVDDKDKIVGFSGKQSTYINLLESPVDKLEDMNYASYMTSGYNYPIGIHIDNDNYVGMPEGTTLTINTLNIQENSFTIQATASTDFLLDGSIFTVGRFIIERYQDSWDILVMYDQDYNEIAYSVYEQYYFPGDPHYDDYYSYDPYYNNEIGHIWRTGIGTGDIVIENKVALFYPDQVDIDAQLDEISIKSVDRAIQRVSTERSKLGALQNRLEYTVKNLDKSFEDLQSAESRIRDVDIAKETINSTVQNILQQSAQAILAQVNQDNQSVIQLLRA